MQTTELTADQSATDVPVPEKLTLVGFTPLQVEAQQSKLAVWLTEKIRAVKNERQNALTLQTTMQKAGLTDGSAKHMVKKADKRIAFYAKVKAALDAGYYIIAPIEAEIFAIRTDRFPTRSRSSWYRSVPQKSRPLPVGEGDYVDPAPYRTHVDTENEVKSDGETRAVHYYANTDWNDDMEFPVACRHPEIIEATGAALQRKIFDAIGVVPQIKNPDPMVVGQIYDYQGRPPLTFFIAWWFEAEEL